MNTNQVISSDGGDGLRLFVESDPNGQVSASVLVRWTITDELRQKLEDSGAIDPHLLLVVSRAGYERSRKVIPLQNMFEFVTFNGPGENVVHATIVWSKADGMGGVTRPDKFFLKKEDYGAYRVSVLDDRNPQADLVLVRITELEKLFYDEDPAKAEEHNRLIRASYEERQRILNDPSKWRLTMADFRSVNHHGGIAELAVTVPEEMFAKNPGRVTQWLVGLTNKFLESKPRDECSMRKRALLGLAIAILWIPVHMIMMFFYALGLLFATTVNGLLVGVLSLFGARGMKSEFVYEPFNHHPGQIIDSIHHSFWYYRKVNGQNHYVRRHPVFNFLNPPVVAVVVLMAWIISNFFGTFLHVMFYAVIVMGAMVLMILFLNKEVSSDTVARRSAADAERTQRLRAKQMDSLGALVAPKDYVPDGVSMDSVPAGRATLHLRFNDLKATVCKPFAR